MPPKSGLRRSGAVRARTSRVEKRGLRRGAALGDCGPFPFGPEHAVEGFSDRVSVVPGQPASAVRLDHSRPLHRHRVSVMGQLSADNAQQVSNPSPPGRHQPRRRYVETGPPHGRGALAKPVTEV